MLIPVFLFEVELQKIRECFPHLEKRLGIFVGADGKGCGEFESSCRSELISPFEIEGINIIP